VLRDFLAEEPGWALRAEFAMRAAVFEKTAPSPRLPEWFAQPFVRRRSHFPGTLGHLLRKLWRTVRRDRARGAALRTRELRAVRHD
jgi:hypothetical protein